MGNKNAAGSARETAYRMIRSRIINLALKPNDNLNDKDLADELGMSRTPVREAVLMLNLENLVVVRPQSGTFVAPIDLEMVEVEQYGRYVMEKEMAYDACRKEREPYRRTYEENLYLCRFYENSMVPDRAARILEMDNAFHRIVFTINGKDQFYDWMMNSFQHIERLRVLSLQMKLDQEIDNDHAEIVTAILGGDAPRAGKAIHRHLIRYQDHVHIIRKHYPEYFKEE